MSETVINKGRSGSPGYAVGKLCVFKRDPYNTPRRKIQDGEAEYLRFEAARTSVLKDLDSMYDTTRNRAGSANADIFAAQAMLLQDEDFLELVHNNILDERKNAEWAVSDASRHFYEIFSSMDDEAVKAKAADLEDVSNKLIALLSDRETGKEMEFPEPVILAAGYISPSELMMIDGRMLKGMVMWEGSAYSHVVILAKTLGIPVVLGTGFPDRLSGCEAVIDGTGGKVIVNPDADTLRFYKGLIEDEINERSRLREYIGRKAVTGDGRSISVFANIGMPADAVKAEENDCEAIGLTRTEFMFTSRDELPTEDDHFEAYKEILEAVKGKPVVFRTLDIGSDKTLKSYELPHEDNPDLGLRAIRICLTDKDIFIPQIKGIMRAAVYGDAAMMYPMITSAGEIARIKEIVQEAESELERDGVPYRHEKQGIMIETPAAALISDELAQLADFFSIGTNDLTQYTIAVDRLNRRMAPFYDSHHRAVIKMIEMTVENAHKAGIKVSICGELAADTSLTESFINMGVDALSVSPMKILELRRFICGL